MLVRKQDTDLRGKTVNVEVYLFVPEDERPRSYVWGVSGKIISAGMMDTANSVVEDIVETYRKREPEYIELSFPNYIPQDFDQKWGGQLRRGITGPCFANFQEALKGYFIIGIGPKKD